VLSRHPELTFQQAANQESTLFPSLASQRWEHGSEVRPWLHLQPRKRTQMPLRASFVLDGKPIAAAISYTGELVAFCTRGTANVYEVQSRRELLNLSVTSTEAYTAMAISPVGRFLATASWSQRRGGKCQLWDIKQRNRIEEFSTGTCRVLSLAFCGDAMTIALGGVTDRDGKLGVFRQSGSHLLWKQTIRSALIRKVVYSDRDRRLIVAQGDGRCSFWNAETGMAYRAPPVIHLLSCPSNLISLSDQSKLSVVSTRIRDPDY
jgi:WD40 repeat protein